jgi:hypothetical protein
MIVLGRRVLVVLLASAVFGSTARADAFGIYSPFPQAPWSPPQGPRVELGIHFGDGMKPTWSLHGSPLSDQRESMRMSCPPPPDHAACQRMQLLVFGIGTLVVLAVAGAVRQK